MAMGVLLLVAGHETTVNLIGNGTLALLKHPDEWEAASRTEMRRRAVQELLRYASPVEMADERYAREDVTLDDVRFRMGGWSSRPGFRQP